MFLTSDRWQGSLSGGQNQLLTSRMRAVLMIQQRFKKGKGAKGEEASSDEEDEDSDKEGDDVDPDEFMDIDFETSSNRLDLAARGGLGIAREKATEGIANGMVRINGLRGNKTDPVDELDIIEFIKGRNQENPDKLDVIRCQVMHVPDTGTSKGRIKLKFRRWRRMTIDNYKEDPYEGVVMTPQDEHIKS